LDAESFSENASFKKVYLNEPLQHSIPKVGGPETLRAICKIAINFFIHNGGDRNTVKHHFPFMSGLEESDFVNPYLVKRDFVPVKEDEVSHVIYIKSKDNILFCYIELFSVYGFLVILNDNYQGSSIEMSYSYDVLNKNEINKEIDFKCESHVLSKYDYRTDEFDDEELINRLKRVAGIGYARQRQRVRDDLISNAIERVFSRYQVGADVTPEFITELTNEVVGELGPFFFRGVDLDFLKPKKPAPK
jgi:hypothetical protein